MSYLSSNYTPVSLVSRLRTYVTWTNLLALCIPIAFSLQIAKASDVVQFAFASMALIPLAGWLGDATEAIEKHSNATIGGLMNATMGNLPELIIALMGVYHNIDDVVKSSLTGSMIGNGLLVLGCSFFYGGYCNGDQKFDDHQSVMTDASMNVLASITLLIPAFLSNTQTMHHTHLMSAAVSVILIVLYICITYFSLKNSVATDSTPDQTITNNIQDEENNIPSYQDSTFISSNYEQPTSHQPALQKQHSFITLGGAKNTENEDEWSLRKALVVMGLVSVLISFISEIVVKTVEKTGQSLGLSNIFLGVIVLAIVGNVSEHAASVVMAGKNKINMSIGISLGSILQIAMFVAPVSVIASFGRGTPMDLLFTPVEVFFVFLSNVLVWMVLSSGTSNKIHGLMLIALYLVMGFAFYVL